MLCTGEAIGCCIGGAQGKGGIVDWGKELSGGFGKGVHGEAVEAF